MKTTSRILILILTISILNLAKADETTERIEILAKSMLLPQLNVRASDRTAWIEYVRRIDESAWSVKKQQTSFLGDLNSTFEGVPFNLGIDSTYSDFDEARKTYMERTNYFSDERETLIVFSQYLTDTQLEQFGNALTSVLGQGGIRIYEKSASVEGVILSIFWIHPPGTPKALIPETTVNGGTVPGAPAGKLFPDDYELKVGSQVVSIVRESGKELRTTINAEGYSASYTLPSEQELTLSTAAPLGTIIQSMLPPHRYGDVTDDDSRFFAKTAKWVPADGREVAGSKYAGLIGSKVPDLRGMFLRGLNTFEPPYSRTDDHRDPNGDNRVAGDIQSDAVGQHNHTFRDVGVHDGLIDRGIPLKRIDNDGWEKAKTTDTLPQSNHPETRPKNIAIYYYIRIN